MTTWTYEPGGWAYTLVSGDYHCRVWRERPGTWHAIVLDHATSSGAHDFSTAEEAQAWCEEQLRTLVAQDRSSG